MAFSNRRHLATLGLMLATVLLLPYRGWSQKPSRIGTVLAVEGTAEVRTQDSAEWERLRFRDAIFLNDTVRTAENGKLKALLSDDSIMTLSERSEMQFTEFLLTQQQRRSVVNLFFGKIRVLTTRLFGADSATEIHTPNAVAGVRGSENITGFEAQTATTTSYCASGDCFISDRNGTDIRDVAAGQIAEQTGLTFQPAIQAATNTAKQTIQSGTNAREGVPGEEQKTEQHEQDTSESASARSDLISTEAPTQTLVSIPAPETDVQREKNLEMVDVANITVPPTPNPAPGDNPASGGDVMTTGGNVTTSDDNPIVNQFTNLNLTITIPR